MCKNKIHCRENTPNENTVIKEYHLFAGIGGGIYGGEILGHICCGAVEIDEFCTDVLKARQRDGWMNDFEILKDVTQLNGNDIRGKFDVLCGGFPCQAFSHAAHGNNISDKNLWPQMFRIIQECDAPIVFGENVTFKAIDKAREDLKSLDYAVKLCKLSCSELGADHRRDRFWLLAVKDRNIFNKIKNHLSSMPKISTNCWTGNPIEKRYEVIKDIRRKQLKAVGNAQSPLVAAAAFRILVNRHVLNLEKNDVNVSKEEINKVVEIKRTWLKTTNGDDFGLVHTPTTMANYSCKSMMKHKGCRNYNAIFGKPKPSDAEYLMGFPIGASLLENNKKDNYESWKRSI